MKRRFRRRLTKVSRLQCLGQDNNKKTPVTKRLVVAFGVLFSMAKSMLKMCSCVRFCCHKVLFLRTKRGKGSPCSVL